MCTCSQWRAGAEVREKVFLRLWWFFQHPNILPQMIPSATKWWNYILRWPLLGSEITPLPDSPYGGAFRMLETVCVNHCSMGWPWDGRYRIISSTTMRWDGAHLSSAGVLQHSLLYDEKLPQPLDVWHSEVTFHPICQHNMAAVPNTISGLQLLH